MQKRGGIKQSVKIETSHLLLSKRNILFMLVLMLLLIMIVYFAIKTWPIMKERLGDGDNDGIKNYQDKCMSTPKGATVDSYGCEISKEAIHKESPTFIEEDIEEENETIIQCSDSDNGKNIWIKGKCNDGSDKKDYCEENFGKKLYEYLCLNNICDKEKIDCSDYNALCYDGRCIDKNKDTDKDGYPDLDEYDKGTDPNNPDDHPGNITIQSNCNSRCVSLGYISGRGPFDSIGRCNSPEVGKYLSGNSGDVCCCMPKQEECKNTFPYCTGSCGVGWCYNIEGQCTCGGYDDAMCNQYCINTKNSRSGRRVHSSQECTGTEVYGNGCCCTPASTGYYSFQQCTSLQNSHGAMFSQRQETDWTQSTCQAYANPRCIATNIGFDRNCCWWSCGAQITNEEKCQQWMTSGGYSYWALGVSSSQACYDKAVQDCTNRGQQYSLSVYQDPTMGCCNWKCKEAPPVPQCYNSNYEEGYRGIEILQHKGYCTDDGGVTQHWSECIDPPNTLEWWVCGDGGKCQRYAYACRDLIPYTYCSSSRDICEPIPGTENIDPPECANICSDYPRSILSSDWCGGVVPPICKKLGSTYSSYAKRENCCCFKCDDID